MIYSYKNIKVKLNNNDVFADNVDLAVNNSLSPNYQANERYNFSYFPTDGIGGSLRLTYYLTGKDFIKEYITDETNSISGNFAGLFFRSGYLSSYSLNAVPHGPVKINADIKFFEELKGAFVDQRPYSETGYKVLNYSDITVDQLGGYSEESFNDVVSVNYSFSSEIDPEYVIPTGTPTANIEPYKVIFGEKSITADVVCSNVNPTMPITGKNMGIKITFNHPQVGNALETFTCSGVLTSKTFSASINNLFLNNISIRQNKIDTEPIISGFDPLSSSPGSFIKISGLNLTNTISVYFHDREAPRFSVLNDRLVSGIVPYDALTGKIKINTYGGSAQTSSNYSLSYPAMAINYVAPYTGLSGQSVLISGNNFYRISHVFFSGESGRFRHINSGVVQAYIPSLAQSGLVRVVSTGRGLHANSLHGYVPIPFISGYSPWTGASGSVISISGFGFNGISILRFNNINSPSFRVMSNILITGAVPSGNVKGYIYLQGVSGVRCLSESKFQPEIRISGIDPLSGLAGDIVRISGYNFQTGLFYQYPEAGKYKVKFGTQITGFALTNTVLSGFLPADFTTGPVSIFEADGATTYSNVTAFKTKYASPTISSFAPTFVPSGQIYNGYVNGTNFFDVTGLMFTGYITENRHRAYFVTPSDLRTDVLGKRINIINYTGFVKPTGTSATPYSATGNFQLYVLTRTYTKSLATSVGNLRIEVVPAL